MLPRPYSLLFAALAATLATTACAQTTAAAPTLPAVKPAAISNALPAPTVDPLLPRVRAAIDAAERGPFDAGQYADIARHPLYGWVEYASLRRNIDSVNNGQAQDFLNRRGNEASGDAFRDIWLAATARREDWAAFTAAWTPKNSSGKDRSVSLRCAELNARQALGKADAQWTKDAQVIWRSSGKSLPDSCDAPFAVLAAQGGLSPELRWERIDAAAAEWQPAVMRAAARGLPADQLAQANDYAAFLDNVNERALAWPKTERSRKIASYGLAKLAKAQPASAEAQLPKYAAALAFSDEDRGRVLYQTALWSVASYDSESARRLNAVPEVAYDERLHEWRAREAMSRSDWAGALAAIRKMGAKQRDESRWEYFEARLSEMAGDKASAARLYRESAKNADFHGFLSSDRLGLPYTLCPVQPKDSVAAKAAIARDPILLRAMGLFQIERAAWAIREWDDALTHYDDTQRRIAIEVAQSYNWFDRAVFSLNKTPNEQRMYYLRFPLHHGDTIRRESARNGIDPAWVAAEIRAESIFNPTARSGANAMGLMQVLPGTGAQVAKSLGLPWGGAASLYDSDTNIILGTAYLRQLLDKYGGQPYFAMAGYNAGPAPLGRWQSQRPGMDPDFWIETISYKETREYVARVLAFSVLYDWRLNGDALKVSDRMRGINNTARKSFTCPASAATATAPLPAETD
ncbi:lytic transglycosylase domain-containing protein [Lysobacter capsici]|uniref:lytic transglycosylase domain-containing protein n=1 Tax=Lysobacter capsici TaxID=435897 RepID=UPI00287B8B94|nr:transglycosylase SLT domain-containing protein [Lysobacter capsici]WND81220.1 transglycosylase SLT domain-containing protein [Lysobacter capsici]WND86416.1 transglycosylase SLT domain-containing protein [Lysobacter capsici]